MVFFKIAGNIHYDLVSPYGERFLPLWMVGLIMGGGSVLQMLLDVPAGHWMDRYGYRRFLIITTVIFAVAGIFYMFGLTPAIYITSFIFAAFGWLFFGPGVNAYALSHATEQNAGRFIAYKDVSGSIGVVVVALSLPFILLLPPQHVGYMLFTVMILALVSISFAPKDLERLHKRPNKMSSQHFHIKRALLGETVRAVKRLNPASGMLVLSNISASTFYGAVWFVVPLVLSRELHNSALSFGLGIFDFSIIVLGVALGKIADRFNKRKLVFSGLLIFAISTVISGLNLDWLFVVFGFMATMGDEMAQLSLWSWLHSLDKDHANDGAVAGVINLFNDMGWALGPILAGFVFDIAGPSWTLVLCALPILISWIIYQFAMHKHSLHLIPSRFLPPRPHRARHKS